MAETKINASACDNTIWTQNSLRAGKNIEVAVKTNPYVIDEHTVACWHFDGSWEDAVSGGIAFSDSRNNSSITTTLGNYKFGTGGWVLTNQYAYNGIVLDTSPTLYSYTIDFWCKGSNNAVDFSGYNSNTVQLSVELNGKLAVYTGLSSNLSVETPRTDGNWHHCAVCVDHSATTVYLFCDGILLGQKTGFKSGYQGFKLNRIGPTVNRSMSAIYFDEIRVSDICRWTSDFEVPTEPYSTSASEPWYVINNTQDISGKLDATTAASTYATKNECQAKQDVLTGATGYDSTKTQVLKNVQGVLTWVDEA